MALDASVTASIRAQYTAPRDLGDLTFNLNDRAAIIYEDGTGAGKADKLFADTRTLAASVSEDLDLAGTMIQDPFNVNLGFVKIKVIHVRANSTNVNNVVVGGAAANAFLGPFGAAAHTIAVPPGGVLMLVHPGDGWVVTAGTADLLRIANSGAGSSVIYDIEIAGASA